MAANNTMPPQSSSTNDETPVVVVGNNPTPTNVASNANSEAATNSQDVPLLIPAGDGQPGGESSGVSNRKKVTTGAVLTSMFVVLMVGSEVVDDVIIPRSNERSVHSLEQKENTFAQSQLKFFNINLQEEKLREKLLPFVESSGILDFKPHGSRNKLYASVKMTRNKSYGEALKLCSYVGASLAEPTSFKEFQAIALSAYGRSHCFVGPTRLDGDSWVTVEGTPVDLDSFWAKGEPSKSITSSCAYVLNKSNSTYLYSAQCNGEMPGIKCFICEKTSY